MSMTKAGSPTTFEQVAETLLSTLESNLPYANDMQLRITSVSIRRSRTTYKPIMTARISGSIFVGHTEEREVLEARRQERKDRVFRV